MRLNAKGQALVEYMFMLLIVVALAQTFYNKLSAYLFGDQGILTEIVQIDQKGYSSFKSYTIPR